MPQLTKSRLTNLAKFNTYTAESSTARAWRSRVTELYTHSIIIFFKRASTLSEYIDNYGIIKFESTCKK